MNTAKDAISHLLAFITLIFSFLQPNKNITVQKAATTLVSPLSIESMRLRSYPGSNITIEQTLSSEKSYNRYIASYQSDGLKIFALLLVPKGTTPNNGWPVIVFNHGYITPEKYTPEGNYFAYTDAFAKNGYIVFKPNYRGNGKSEGMSTGAYFSPDYATDDLNAISSIKKYPSADPNRIGVWGHSMGGNITLRDLVVNRTDIKAAVIWAGVVGSYTDIIYNWQNRVTYQPDKEDLALRNRHRDLFLGMYGTPEQNPNFWNSIDPTNYLKDITAPVQIQVGLADIQVPPDFSKGLYEKLRAEGKMVEYFEYPGSNHDINQDFTKAMQRSIDFFNRYLK